MNLLIVDRKFESGERFEFFGVNMTEGNTLIFLKETDQMSDFGFHKTSKDQMVLFGFSSTKKADIMFVSREEINFLKQVFPGFLLSHDIQHYS